jgi:hypothetical protein
MLAIFLSPADSYWQQLLQTIPHDFYHLPGYLELEAKRYHATPEAILIKDDDRVFFLPYLIRDCSNLFNEQGHDLDPIYDIISPYGYPGILVNQAGEDPEFISKCLNLAYSCWQDKNICSAFIRLHPIVNSYINDSTFGNNKFGFCHQGDVVICDLAKDNDLLWSQVRSSHRNKIAKLRRAGFTVTMGSEHEYLDIFIDIYRQTMDRVNASKSYYFTKDYFEDIFQVLIDRLNICVVKIDEQVVAASLVTEVDGIVQYHLGGTKTEFLKQSPTTMMFKYMIDWAKQRGNRYVNFGGGLGGNRDSLYHFKAGFSNEVRSFTTIRAIIDRKNYTHLVHSRAESLAIKRSDLENISFFPAYRFC